MIHKQYLYQQEPGKTRTTKNLLYASNQSQNDTQLSTHELTSYACSVKVAGINQPYLQLVLDFRHETLVGCPYALSLRSCPSQYTLSCAYAALGAHLKTKQSRRRNEEKETLKSAVAL